MPVVSGILPSSLQKSQEQLKAREEIPSNELIEELMREMYGETWNPYTNTLEENLNIIEELGRDNLGQINEMSQNGAPEDVVENAGSINSSNMAVARLARQETSYSTTQEEATVIEVANAARSQRALNTVMRKANALFKTVGIGVYASLRTPLYAISHMNYKSNLKEELKIQYREESRLAELTNKYNWAAVRRTRRENMRRLRKKLTPLDPNTIIYTPKEKEKLEKQRNKLEKISSRVAKWKNKLSRAEEKQKSIWLAAASTAKSIISKEEKADEVVLSEEPVVKKDDEPKIVEPKEVSAPPVEEVSSEEKEEAPKESQKVPEKKNHNGAKLILQAVAVDPLKIGQLFGKAGGTIKAIKESTGVHSIDIKGDKAIVKAYSQDAIDAATKNIGWIMNGLSKGDKFEGTIVSVNKEKNYAIANLAPGVRANVFTGAFTKDKDASIEEFVSEGTKINATYLGEKEGKNGKSYPQYDYEVARSEKDTKSMETKDNEATPKSFDWRKDIDCTNALNSLGIVRGTDIYRSLETECLKHKDKGWLSFDNAQLAAVTSLMLSSAYNKNLALEPIINTAIEKGFSGKQMDVLFSACIEHPDINMIEKFNKDISPERIYQCTTAMAKITERELDVDTDTLQKLSIPQIQAIELLVREESAYDYSDKEINDVIAFFEAHPAVSSIESYVIMTAHEEAMQNKIKESHDASQVSQDVEDIDLPFPNVTSSEITAMAEDYYNESGSLLDQFIEWQDNATPVLEANGLSNDEATCVVNGTALSKMFIFDTQSLEYTGERTANPFKDTVIRGVELFPEAIDELDPVMKRDLDFMKACYAVNPDCEMYMDADIAEKVINAPQYNVKNDISGEISFRLKSLGGENHADAGDIAMYEGSKTPVRNLEYSRDAR